MVSYQALFRLSVYKIPVVYLSGAKNVCFCTIRDFGSPAISDGYNEKENEEKREMTRKIKPRCAKTYLITIFKHVNDQLSDLHKYPFYHDKDHFLTYHTVAILSEF